MQTSVMFLSLTGGMTETDGNSSPLQNHATRFVFDFLYDSVDFYFTLFKKVAVFMSFQSLCERLISKVEVRADRSVLFIL